MVAGPQTISEAERRRVKEAIARAETRTSGEIVVVVARWCDEYLYVPVLWGSLVALLLPLPLLVLSRLNPVSIFALQLAAFALLSIVLSIWPVRMAVTPRTLKEKHCRKTALEQFQARAIPTTKGRSGLLIFVALEERYCEILVDTAIAARIDASQWQRIVAMAASLIGEGRLGDGLVRSVDACGELLGEHFPPRRVDRNELPDPLVLLNMESPRREA
jgi:putative membrane protein